MQMNLRMKHRKPKTTSKPGSESLPWEEHGGNLLTGHAVSGVKEA